VRALAAADGEAPGVMAAPAAIAGELFALVTGGARGEN
jgi:hypothetical protein